ncbi:NUDIX domain-containing protein [Kitasatospora sp. NPDC057198]|uniref:NUDIX domain-containing protein n=1 Tax=Kitasatospora sp. NPDC057198 TaxID=3346046 RepID=UPI0036260D7E
MPSAAGNDATKHIPEAPDGKPTSMLQTRVQRNEHPRRRLGCTVLITLRTIDPDDPRNGSVLTVETDHAARPALPGGAAYPGEPIGVAAARGLLEGTGLRRTITWALLVDQVPGDARGLEAVDVVCEGGSLTEAEAQAMSIPVDALEEIRGLVWIRPNQLVHTLEPHQAGRVRSALAARESGQGIPLLNAGTPHLGSTGTP